jgi:hypothetical protein
MSHANQGGALARSFPSTSRGPEAFSDRGGSFGRIALDRLRPADLELDTEARSVWSAVLEDVNVLQLFSGTQIYHRIAKLTKRDGRYCPLVSLAELIVWIANRGISEARVRLILGWLDGVVSTVYAGRAHADLDTLDLAEDEAESVENALSWRRRVTEGAGRAVTREEYEAEALANLKEAAICQTRARELCRRGRLLSQGALA